MAKTVERNADAFGMWWVREDGVRKAKFRTRTEARLYASGGEKTPGPQVLTSLSRAALLAIFREHGDARMTEILRNLDPLDMRIVDLHVRGATQAEVALSVGLSQPSVCYRLHQAVARIQFLLKVPRVDPRVMREALTPYFKQPIDVYILVMFVETTSQSEVARRLGVSQGFVRHRIQRSLKILEGVPSLASYLETVRQTQAHLNILNVSRVRGGSGGPGSRPSSAPGSLPDPEASSEPG